MTNNYEEFKSYLKKIGSGEFTGKNLTREETKSALKLMLKEEASAAQIGGFMIAHRIRPVSYTHLTLPTTPYV